MSTTVMIASVLAIHDMDRLSFIDTHATSVQLKAGHRAGFMCWMLHSMCVSRVVMTESI